MSSALIASAASKGEVITPVMRSVLWEISSLLDEQRVDPAKVKDAIWVESPCVRLRPEGRSDNVWLREILRRLMTIEISGANRGEPWGAVIIAEYEFTQGGSLVRLLIPRSAVRAILSPAIFAKIEIEAAHRLSGHARQLYALLADKKRMAQPWWVFPLTELRALLGVADKPTYLRWQDFKKRVLDPALAAINDFGTVSVHMTPKKMGRSVSAVRFDWRWKDQHEAVETAVENERHSLARRKPPPEDDPPSAPPLVAQKKLPPRDTPEWREKMGLPPRPVPESAPAPEPRLLRKAGAAVKAAPAPTPSPKAKPEPEPKLLRKAGAAVKAALAPPTKEDFARGRKNFEDEIATPFRKAAKAVREKLSAKPASKAKPRLKPA